MYIELYKFHGYRKLLCMGMTDAHRFEFPNEESRDLFHAMMTLESVEEFEEFFRDLCTMQELKEMTERWSIAKLVWQDCPYRVISQKTGASSTTIARVAHWLMYGKGGYQKVCRKQCGDMAKGKSTASKERGEHALPR